jgi:hypothetical protein
MYKIINKNHYSSVKSGDQKKSNTWLLYFITFIFIEKLTNV